MNLFNQLKDARPENKRFVSSDFALKNLKTDTKEAETKINTILYEAVHDERKSSKSPESFHAVLNEWVRLS